MKTWTQAILLLAVSAISCWADTIVDPHHGDPLHGYCGVGQCIDNGTNSPTTNNPPQDFGFTASGGPTSGDLLLDLLVPDNLAGGPSFGITGTLTGTAILFSAAPWTSGDLATFLGLSPAKPANPIGAYLPSTQALDPGATGFFVYQVDLGMTILQSPSSPNVSPLENISSGVLPIASYIVGFLNTGTPTAPDYIATANSGAIFETSPHVIPEPSSIILLGSVTLGIVALLKRKTRVRT
jgi:hypothetical protein